MPASLPYNGALTCSIEVRDLKASIAWYQDVLGFKHLYTVDEIGWCELASSVAKVNVGLGQVEAVQPRGGATLTWGVGDIDAARAELERKRVRFDGPTMTIEGMVKLATFFDPDGNKHMFFQDLQQGH